MKKGDGKMKKIYDAPEIGILKIVLSPLLDTSLGITDNPGSGDGTGHHGGNDFSDLPEAKGYFYAPIEEWDGWD